MNFTVEQLQYPLKERIGDPNLFVERAQEAAEFHKWFAGIPKMLSKSRVVGEDRVYPTPVQPTLER
ncbi:MAG: hypothetical protein QNK37_14115 [Acidobacteriota bacterium]|nr:hypothetical protein [Acidobacteriota bacterium]